MCMPSTSSLTPTPKGLPSSAPYGAGPPTPVDWYPWKPTPERSKMRQKDLTPVYMEGLCAACLSHTVVHKDTRLCVQNKCLLERRATRDRILQVVIGEQGCKAVSLVVQVRHANTLVVLSEMIGNGEIVEVEYTLPSMPDRLKSFLLPAGSTVVAK